MHKDKERIKVRNHRGNATIGKYNVFTIILLVFLIGVPAAAGEVSRKLQAVLDRGEDLILEKGRVYDLDETLHYQFADQKIVTGDASSISEYARLRITDPNLMMIIHGNQKDNIVLKNVIVDGNRYRLSTVPKATVTGGGGQPPMVVIGGKGAEGQKVLNNVFMSTRTWSTLKIHEGSADCLVEGNIFLGAGVDPRGNGRETSESPFSWGDAISCAAEKTTIRDNLIIDPTDVGIVFYGAPGSIAEHNVIACISRESLGGINMVDGFLYPLGNKDESGKYGAKSRDEIKNEKENRREDYGYYDYSGTTVRNNYVDAYGARIHIAFPMGPGIWVPATRNKTLVGATVHGNTLAGGAAGYGFIVNGVDGFSVYENKSIANHSGRGEGLNAKRPPDEPAAFLFDPERTANSRLQREFRPCERHLLHLLRCNHGKTNERGYRIYPYGEYEIRAVINAAYLEMLGRDPSQKEMEETLTWMQENQSPADQLRRNLMQSREFKTQYGHVDLEELHPYRIKLWMRNLDAIQREYLSGHGCLPPARKLYEAALSRLNREPIRRVDASTLTHKVMCGYQGWYRCPGDGTGLSWVHWRGRNLNLYDGNCGIDFWPDMRELDQDEHFKPHKFFHADGSPAYVYSNAHPKTTRRHFKWMHDYGIDGVFVQRFTMEVTIEWDAEAVYSREGYNRVLALCREGANRYGRTYTIMYDLTSMPSSHVDKMINDWKYLVDVMKITRNAEDKAYQHHKGAPVVGIWGVGFRNRPYTREDCERLVDFFKNDPEYGGCTLLLGVPTNWRSGDGDASNDPAWRELYRKADILSPWMVGRLKTVADVREYAGNRAKEDLQWCRENGLEFMPVVYPGFSWKNLTGKDAFISREDGRFLWTQYHDLIKTGHTMIYQAMFDELDEGTQIYKITNNPPVGESHFLTYEGLPSDHYLWLVGQATQMLRGGVALQERIPERPGYERVNERIAEGYLEKEK